MASNKRWPNGSLEIGMFIFVSCRQYALLLLCSIQHFVLGEYDVLSLWNKVGIVVRSAQGLPTDRARNGSKMREVLSVISVCRRSGASVGR